MTEAPGDGPRPRWGSFLRSFTWGNVRQLEQRAGSCWHSWPAWRRCCPARIVFVDLDSMQRLVYGHEKQGAAVGYTKTRGKTVEGCGIVSQLLTCGIPG